MEARPPPQPWPQRHTAACGDSRARPGALAPAFAGAWGVRFPLSRETEIKRGSSAARAMALIGAGTYHAGRTGHTERAAPATGHRPLHGEMEMIPSYSTCGSSSKYQNSGLLR